MIGPRPRGFWSRDEARAFAPLVSGKRYRVVSPFVDFDGHDHPVDETWTFVSVSYAPYDDGVSWFVSMRPEEEWHIRLQWGSESAHVLNHVAAHLVEVGGSG